MYVFYFVCYQSDTWALLRASEEPKIHFCLHPAFPARWRETHERPFAGWSGGSETRAPPPPPSAWMIRKTSEALDPRHPLSHRSSGGRGSGVVDASLAAC